MAAMPAVMVYGKEWLMTDLIWIQHYKNMTASQSMEMIQDKQGVFSSYAASWAPSALFK